MPRPSKEGNWGYLCFILFHRLHYSHSSLEGLLSRWLPDSGVKASPRPACEVTQLRLKSLLL